MPTRGSPHCSARSTRHATTSLLSPDSPTVSPRVLLPRVLLATAFTALAWSQIDPDRAFWIALSVLVISCPCALSLATPATLANAAALLRRQGVIVHGENALESLSRVTHVALRQNRYADHRRVSTSRQRVHPRRRYTDATISLRIAAALQRHSNHPLASAFSAIAPAAILDDIRYIVGAGLEGRAVDGRLRLALALSAASWRVSRIPATAPLYWIALGRRHASARLAGLDDALREARAILERFQRTGVRTELLTGDASPRAGQLGFDPWL